MVNYDLGQRVCDMHDGLPDGAFHHFTVATDKSTEALVQIIEGVLGGDFYPHNKIAYVIGERNGGLVCAYSYDGRMLGFFTIPFSHPGEA